MPPKPMQGLAGRFAEDIPKRNVNRRLRHHGNPAAPAGQRRAPQIAPDGFNGSGVTPNDARCHRFRDAGANGALQGQVQQMQIAHAGNARLRGDFHHHQITHRPKRMARQPRVIHPGHLQ